MLDDPQWQPEPEPALQLWPGGHNFSYLLQRDLSREEVEADLREEDRDDYFWPDYYPDPLPAGTRLWLEDSAHNDRMPILYRAMKYPRLKIPWFLMPENIVERFYPIDTIMVSLQDYDLRSFASDLLSMLHHEQQINLAHMTIRLNDPSIIGGWLEEQIRLRGLKLDNIEDTLILHREEGVQETAHD